MVAVFDRYVGARAVGNVLRAALVCALLYFVIDYADRSSMYAASDVATVVRYYGYRFSVAARDFGPFVVLLGIASTLVSLRWRGELTAAASLGGSPWQVLRPLLVVCAAFVVLLAWHAEVWATEHGWAMDEFQVSRFGRLGDYRLHYGEVRWFVSGSTVVHSAGKMSDTRMEEVTVFRLGKDFAVVERLDAPEMDWEAGDTWKLLRVERREFGPDGLVASNTLPQMSETLPRLRTMVQTRRQGRPEFMRLTPLREQIATRRLQGDQATGFEYAMHSRFSHAALAGSAAWLMGVLLLRPRGRTVAWRQLAPVGLAAAIAVGLVITLRASALAGRMAPALAAWAPHVVLIALGWFVYVADQRRLVAYGE